jgi:radical SAM protein with 4Fe4S-binding SPASM domain
MRTSPDYIQFYPTLRCNMACEFCFNRNMPPMPDMPLENFRVMLGKLKNAGVRTIDIIGGEPTLHRDIAAMARESEESGFGVNLSSNGTNIETLAQILRTAKSTAVGISINDRETLTHVKEFIGKHKPVVKTVFRSNLDHGMIADILALRPKKFYLLFRDAMDADDLRETVPFDLFFRTVKKKFNPSVTGMVYPVRESGREVSAVDSLSLQNCNLSSIEDVLSNGVYCSGFLPDTGSCPALSGARCPAGTTKLGAMPDGSVYPCNLFFGIERFRLGNVLTDPFERIWNHPTLAFFRSFTKNDCPRTSCDLHARCHGGCPAHGLIHKNNLSAPDPRCVKK